MFLIFPQVRQNWVRDVPYIEQSTLFWNNLDLKTVIFNITLGEAEKGRASELF